MQDNISSKEIGNRNITLELRYAPTMSVVDNRGQIIDAFKKADIFDVQSWGIGDDRLILRDSEDEDDAKNIVRVSYNTCQYSSQAISSVESYLSKMEKLVRLLNSLIVDFDVRLVLCRIVGTYMVSNHSFSDVVSAFKNAFPSQLFLTDYSVKDMMFRLIYDFGRYTVCPVDKEDDIFEEEFGKGVARHVGFAIETNNRITLENGQNFSFQVVKDVYKLSLSVERDLFTKISSMIAK